MYGSHVTAEGKIVPPARLHPGIEKRRAVRTGARKAALQAEGGKPQPVSPALAGTSPGHAGAGSGATTAWKEHVVSNRSVRKT